LDELDSTVRFGSESDLMVDSSDNLGKVEVDIGDLGVREGKGMVLLRDLAQAGVEVVDETFLRVGVLELPSSWDSGESVGDDCERE